MGMTCKTCGLDNPDYTRNCVRCGAFLNGKEGHALNCGFCGKLNPPSAEICEFCGAHLLKSTAQDPPSATGLPSEGSTTNPAATTSNELVIPEIMSPQTPPQQAYIPNFPSPPVEKPKKNRVKSILHPILLCGTYVGFIGLVVWLIIVLARISIV